MRKKLQWSIFLLPNRIFDERLSPNEFIVYSFLVRAKDSAGQSFWSVPMIAKSCSMCASTCRKSFAFAGKCRVHNDLEAVYRWRAKEQSIHGQQDLMHRALGFIGKEYERL